MTQTPEGPLELLERIEAELDACSDVAVEMLDLHAELLEEGIEPRLTDEQAAAVAQLVEHALMLVAEVRASVEAIAAVRGVVDDVQRQVYAPLLDEAAAQGVLVDVNGQPLNREQRRRLARG